MAGDLALDGPDVSVYVEDPMAKKLLEDRVKARAFDIIGEIGAEEMVNISRVSGADAVGESEESVDLDGRRVGGGEHVGDPVVEAVAVAEEPDEVSDHRI